MKIMTVFGTRPEAIKMVPVIRGLSSSPGKKYRVVTCLTAQHRHMLDQVMSIFGIRAKYDLDIMTESQSLSQITSRVIERLIPVLEEEEPSLVLVHGDTTTTFASALAAYYCRIPVGHVEAGLRSFDRYNPFPEEMNRVMTDSLCDLHFAPTLQAKKNLLRQGISARSIYVTGNTVIDALKLALRKEHQFASPVLRRFFRIGGICSSRRVIMVTAHRRENWGEPLMQICSALKRIAFMHQDVEIFYPVHLNPAIRDQVNSVLRGSSRIHLLEPLGYLDFVNLMKRSYLVLTDSGGLQEEAPSLGKPVLVLRKVTERPEAVKAGTVRVIGTSDKKIVDSAARLLSSAAEYRKMATAVNPYGDGRASIRIRKAVTEFFKKREKERKGDIPWKV